MSATEYVRSAADGKTSIPAYSLLIAHKVPAKSMSDKMGATTVLLDTGASVSLMPAWQAEALKVQVTPRTDIVIRGADGRKLAVNGKCGSGIRVQPIGRKLKWLSHETDPGL